MKGKFLEIDNTLIAIVNGCHKATFSGTSLDSLSFSCFTISKVSRFLPVVRKIVFDDVNVILKWDSQIYLFKLVSHIQFHSITYSRWLAFIMLHKFTSIQRWNLFWYLDDVNVILKWYSQYSFPCSLYITNKKYH